MFGSAIGVGVNSSGEFTCTQFVREKIKQLQTLKNLREKSAVGKNHGAEREREISLNQRDYKEFSALCYIFNSLGFDPFQGGRD